MKGLWKKGIAGEQRGAFIVFTALALWFLLMFVAFAVDFGNYYQHKTRLQNAADAAALAGVAKYAEETKNNSAVSTTTSKGRLVKLPSDSNVSSFSSGSYSFNKEAGNVSDTVHESAKGYVMSNYVQNDSTHNGVSMFDSIWSATGDATESKETNGITTKITTVTPKSYCYRIDLTDTIPTFFARIFGKDSLEVSVSAMAMLDRKDTEETTDITAEDVLMQIAQNLSAIAPNYFWETITYNKKGAYTISGKEITAFTADEKKRNRYVTGDKVDTAGNIANYEEIVEPGTIYDGTGHLLGYREPTAEEGGLFGKPIYLADNALSEANTYVSTRVFKIKSALYNGNRIFVLLLDRDNIYKSDGVRERFSRIELGPIGTVDEEKEDTTVPLYLRLESEPPDVGNAGNGLSTVGSIDIKFMDSVKTNPKPVVIIYEGPEQVRTRLDAPWISTIHADQKKGQVVKSNGKTFVLKAGQIQKDAEPISGSYDNDADVPDFMKHSCIKTTAPVVIEIPDGCTFNGAVYMPRSQVTIKGTGAINGFIVAKEIIQEPSCGRTFIESKFVSLPTLSVVSIGARDTKEKTIEYKESVIAGNFNMVYTTLDLSLVSMEHLDKFNKKDE